MITELSRDELRDRLAALCVRRGLFTLASGGTATVYLDVRRASLHPSALGALADALTARIVPFVPDAVGGPVVGAIPLVAAIVVRRSASAQPWPGFMVRAETKTHGTGQRVDGYLEVGWRVALIEDVVTSGGSVLGAVKAVREAGAEVAVVACVVDREQGGRAALEAVGVPLEALFTMREILGDEGTRA
jgi:orotate phosphoribosyltransferase